MVEGGGRFNSRGGAILQNAPRTKPMSAAKAKRFAGRPAHLILGEQRPLPSNLGRDSSSAPLAGCSRAVVGSGERREVGWW